MNKKRLAIIGAGGLGRELKAWISKLPAYELIGFFDDNVRNTHIGATPVLGPVSAVSGYAAERLNLIVAIGDPLTKQRIIGQLEALRLESLVFPSIAHPRAIVEDVDSIGVGEGTVITAGCVLTTEVTLGKHVLVNLNCTLGHDVMVGDYTSLMPGVSLSGKVRIGKGVLIGTGASVLGGIFIGDQARVGAGAVVLKDIPDRCTAVGVPAKIISV